MKFCIFSKYTLAAHIQTLVVCHLNLHKTAFSSIFKLFYKLFIFKKYLLFFNLSWFAFKAMAQDANNYYLEKKLYTYWDGLPGRTIRQGAQDSRGFLWFITNNGLCRFDGKVFEVFTKQSHGLYNNNISSIISDQGNGIVINYFSDKSKFTISNEHIDVIDVYTLKVKHLKQHYQNVPFNEEDLSEVRYDPDENNILFFLKPYYNRHIETFADAEIWRLDSKGNFSPKKNNAIKVVDFVKKGKDVVATVEPYSFSMGLKNHAMFMFEEGTMMAREGYHSQLIYKDDKGGFMLRYSDSSTTKYFYLSNTIKEVSEKDTAYPPFIFYPDVHYFNVRMDHTGILFVKNKTLYLYKNHSTIALIDSTDSEKIRKAQILSVFRDNIGNYWISTNEGVLRVSLKQKKFLHLFSYKQIPSGLNNSSRGFYRKKDQLFVATFDFIGIKKNNTTDIIKNYYNFGFCENGGKFWVASTGLEQHDLAMKHKQRMTGGQSLGELWSLFPLDDNRLLLGGSNGAGVYNISQNAATAVNTGKFQTPGLVYRFFNYQNNIIGVSSNGIYVLNKEGKVIDCFNRSQSDSSKQLLLDEINDLQIDKRGLFWIATAFDGLYCWDRKSGKLEQFGIENGFLSTTHYRIEEDDYNNLWISTEFGLAKFNKTTKKAKVYTESDGISHNEFNRGSSFKDADGTLYFGGMNGVTYFHPKDFFEEEGLKDYPFVVNKVSFYNSGTNIMEDQTVQFFSDEEIVLQGNTKNASIEVALLDFEDRVHTYAYQIEGLSDEWSYIKDGTIKLNNLPYGNYKLRVKGQCLNGLWNITEISIPLIVPIPVYKTWWFMVVLVIVFLALVFVFFKQRTKLLRKQNEKLEQTVERRTLELKESLAEQIALLQEVHHRVKNNLQFIAAMLKMQINSIKDESNQAVLKETSRRINSMSLVHEMLYNKDKLESVSVNEYLTELVKKLDEMIYDHHEPIKFNLSIEDIKFNINNCVAIGMITSEIISNTIKYAFNKLQHAEVSISLVYDDDLKQVVYIIRDNGVGMSEGTEGTGLGMRLIDIFSRQMEAKYERKNRNGLMYTFKIPYDKKE